MSRLTHQFQRTWMRPPTQEELQSMVDELVKKSGSAYDPVLYEFISDVKNDQNAEIERMSASVLRCLEINVLGPFSTRSPTTRIMSS